MHGAQHAGLSGAGTITTDAGSDMFSLTSPGVEQAINALRDRPERSPINVLPPHGLYRHASR